MGDASTTADHLPGDHREREPRAGRGGPPVSRPGRVARPLG
ncbi:hypothetical protein ABZ436_27775 [Micromonospora matsumotoense]